MCRYYLLSGSLQKNVISFLTNYIESDKINEKISCIISNHPLLLKTYRTREGECVRPVAHLEWAGSAGDPAAHLLRPRLADCLGAPAPVEWAQR